MFPGMVKDGSRPWHSTAEPSPTLSKSGNAAIEDFGELRSFTSGECKRLQSYPDAFRLIGRESDQIARIGNSVPPLFMRAVAIRVRELIGKPMTMLAKSNGQTGYLASLESAWADHLKPREPDAPTVISLFAGCGGSSLGYSMAGYRELLAVEWDANAVATFKLNFPGVKVCQIDIRHLSVELCMRLAGIKEGELDVLDGSPPCQGFSMAGKRVLDDPRNSLFREYVRLLRGLKPKAFVMENVSGMVKGKMKLVFAEILRELKASGYVVKARVLNAMYYGVPQSRERMIFVGIRDDLRIEPGHPAEQSKPIPIKAACPDIGFLVLGSHGQYKGRIVNAALESSPSICKSGMPSFSHGIMENDQPPPFRNFNRDLWLKQKPGQNGDGKSYYNHVKVDPNKPSPTVPKSAVFGGFSGLSHWKEPRALKLTELARIGSYPDAFRFTGNYENGLNCIGNSVPPIFMHAITAHVRKLLKSSQDAS